MVRLIQHDRPRVPNYSSRSEQWRLLLLIVPLGLVLIVMGRLRDPQTADRINAFFAPGDTNPRREVAESETPFPVALFPGILAEHLEAIEDNTYFRNAEKEAWFHFLGLLQKQTFDTVRGAPVDYVQLVDQPHVYRGKLVTVRGTAKQISEEKPAENELGLASYFRVVIQPADGTNWPIIVYCLTLPPDVSTGDDRSIAVNVTGLFFKKLSYKWQDGLGIAPVILAKSFVASAGVDTPPPEKEIVHDRPVISDDSSGTSIVVDDLLNDQAAFKKILSLAGWDADRLARFDEGESLTEDQRYEALELLRRLRSIDSTNLSDWCSNLGLTRELKEPDDIRGQLCRLVGRVTKVIERAPTAADAERLEMPVYYECEFAAAELADHVTILTARVPKDWLQADDVNEVATANVLFVKRLNDESPARTLWLAKEIAWHPSISTSLPGKSIDELFRGSRDPLLGKSVLGTLMVDVGQFDLIKSRGRIRAQERDSFYQIMSAAGHIKPDTLVRIANENLPVVKQEWERRLQDGGSAREKMLAREIVRRADEGRYSAALLFNDPDPQIGRLFVFDGVARRAVRVEVDQAAAGAGSSDLAERYDVDHYYELEVFTDDSQNYPLVFCVRELPAGFPAGSSIHVPVRVAGFFFKDWLYHPRGRAEAAGGRGQYAPLFIGRAPLVLATDQGGKDASRLALGVLFVTALGGIGAIAAWYARGDRRFRESVLAERFSLPPGQSLNEMNLPAADEPIKD